MDTLERGWGAARIARALLLALLAYWTLRLATGGSRWCPLDWANVPFHEAGHVLLSPFGHLLHVLGGTLFQLAVPVVLAIWAIAKHRRPFVAAACAWWVGESANNVAIYMADARDLRLDLVGGGEHDWNELFYRLGVLDEPHVQAIAGATRALAILVMLAGLAWVTVFVLPARFRGGLVVRLAGVAPRAARLLDG